MFEAEILNDWSTFHSATQIWICADAHVNYLNGIPFFRLKMRNTFIGTYWSMDKKKKKSEEISAQQHLKWQWFQTNVENSVNGFFFFLSFASLLHQIILTIFFSLVGVSHIMIWQMEFCLQINLNGSHISLNAKTFCWRLVPPTL